MGVPIPSGGNGAHLRPPGARSARHAPAGPDRAERSGERRAEDPPEHRPECPTSPALARRGGVGSRVGPCPGVEDLSGHRRAETSRARCLVIDIPAPSPHLGEPESAPGSGRDRLGFPDETPRPADRATPWLTVIDGRAVARRRWLPSSPTFAGMGSAYPSPAATRSISSTGSGVPTRTSTSFCRSRICPLWSSPFRAVDTSGLPRPGPAAWS